MKENIKARLKVKFAGVNLSKTRLDAIADKIAGKVAADADDTAIDAALDVMNDYYSFADIAKDDDKLRTAESKVPKPAKEEKPAEEKPPADEMPAWAKTLVDTVGKLTAEKQTATIKDKIKANPKLKDIPASYYAKWQQPDNEDGIDAFADEVATEYATFATEHGILKQEGTAPAFPAPTGGQPAKGGVKKVDADVVNFAKKQNETVVKKTA